MNKEKLYVIGVYVAMIIAPCTGIALAGILFLLLHKG